MLDIFYTSPQELIVAQLNHEIELAPEHVVTNDFLRFQEWMLVQVIHELELVLEQYWQNDEEIREHASAHRRWVAQMQRKIAQLYRLQAALRHKVRRLEQITAELKDEQPRQQ